MIDTDKYEGHTEGKWRVSGYSRKGTFTVKKGEYEVAAVNDYPDARLIADAPLLLEEVKRLRKTLACIAFSPDDPKWVGEKLDDLAVDSDTWIRWME